MAFLIHQTDDGRALPWEYLPASAITPKIGLALVLSSGQLALATATTKPDYICMTETGAAVTAGTIIPVIRVSKDIEFETVNTASLASVPIGSKVTLHTDGLKVTATTTSGVAEITYKAGDAVGSVVRVRFAD